MKLNLWAKRFARDVPRDIKPKDRVLWVVNRERAKTGKAAYDALGDAVDAMLAGPSGPAIRAEAEALMGEAEGGGLAELGI